MRTYEDLEKNISVDDIKKKKKNRLIDISIYLEANRHRISYDVVNDLYDAYVLENGNDKPKSLADLLEVVC